MADDIPDRSIRICADRGGTFCDIYASWPDPENNGHTKQVILKLLSQDPQNYADAPTEGIRRILSQALASHLPPSQPIPTQKIDYIRLSTTLATNALLTRTGEPHALITTKGMKDFLVIGNQSRPRIFDLNIKRAEPLYGDVVEVDERVTLVGYESDPMRAEHAVHFDKEGNVTRGYRGIGWDGDGPGKVVRGLTGEAVRIIKEPDLKIVKNDLETLYKKGYRSLSITLLHSYTFPTHERLIKDIAHSIGFTHVSASSELMPMIRMVPRGGAGCVDAYLTPVLKEYLDGFFKGFDKDLKKGNVRTPTILDAEEEKDTDEKGQDPLKRPPRVEFMASDGGLVDLPNFSGLKSIISGPAGGVVGYALTSWSEDLGWGVIGLDIGGTSTDVSLFPRPPYPLITESLLPSTSFPLFAPQLDINTVAAGGGSILGFEGGLVRCGPGSAGSDPGAKCYRKGGPLALTDANLHLGRLVPHYFPHIFGPNADLPLDVEASTQALGELAGRIREEYGGDAALDEIVYGFVKVANETMCRPIRALTEAKGYELGKLVLASFGGAGGQHACEIARLLGIKVILIHKYSSVLSAYGLGLADRTYTLQSPTSTPYTPTTHASLIHQLDHLENKVRKELARQGFKGTWGEKGGRVQVERMLNMRFEGTDRGVVVIGKKVVDEQGQEKEEFEEEFKRMYREEYGFVLDKGVVVDDIKVRGTGKTFDTLPPSPLSLLFSPSPSPATAQISPSFPLHPLTSSSAHSTHSVYFDKLGRVETPVFLLEQMKEGDEVRGPAMVVDGTQTIVVVPGARGVLVGNGFVILLD